MSKPLMIISYCVANVMMFGSGIMCSLLTANDERVTVFALVAVLSGAIYGVMLAIYLWCRERNAKRATI